MMIIIMVIKEGEEGEREERGRETVIGWFCKIVVQVIYVIVITLFGSLLAFFLNDDHHYAGLRETVRSLQIANEDYFKLLLSIFRENEQNVHSKNLY